MTQMSLFEKISKGLIPSYTVWEDEDYMAFLTPYPNTIGFTVVIPKRNVGDYVFSISDADYGGLLRSVKKVAKLLEKAFGTPRIAMIFEGTGVAHVHAKLIPLHGDIGGQTNVSSKHLEFYPQYVGYLSTVEGPEMSADELKKIQAKIRNAA